jgi:hypothetical protein
MVEKAVERFNDTLYELRYRVRQTMQAVLLQFDIMHDAVEKCGDITHKISYIGCVEASDTAYKEVLKFRELTNKLAEQVKELNSYVKEMQHEQNNR